MTQRRLPRWNEIRPLIGESSGIGLTARARVDRAQDVWDLRVLARRRVPRAVFDYVDGAAGSELTLSRARGLYAQVEFDPRVLRDVSSVDPSTKIVGSSSSLPVVLAPTGFTRMMHHAGESAVGAAAAAARVPYALSTLGTTSIEDLAGAAPTAELWFQLYLMKDRALAVDLLARAAESGYRNVVITVDTPVAGRRLRDARNGLNVPPRLNVSTLANMARYPSWWLNLLTTEPLTFASMSSTAGSVEDLINRLFDPQITFDDIDWLRSTWPGGVIVKGVQSVEDATCLAARGVDGIVLSNHGGRQLDKAPLPLELLRPTRDALGDEVALLVDGGIMSGADVVAAVALGADATQIGRAYLYGLMAGGEAGVARVLELLEIEIRVTMALLGVTALSELTPGHVRLR
jgi:L-lactate dehydrogenase (cytochrome)